MQQPSLNLPIAPMKPRRGRPPGAKSKRSLDLAKYIEARFAGATPGQQSAELCMVTPKDVREAKARAKELQILDFDIHPLMLAMVVKAKQLARALGCTSTEAWILLQKERDQLMAYVHQKRAQEAPTKPDDRLAHVFLVREGESAGGDLLDLTSDDGEGLEFLDDLPAPSDQVARPKSDDAP